MFGPYTDLFGGLSAIFHLAGLDDRHQPRKILDPLVELEVTVSGLHRYRPVTHGMIKFLLDIHSSKATLLSGGIR
jgi:hypothetical protein